MSRARVEQVSRPVLVRIHAWPRFMVPVATVLLIVVGALAPLAVAIPALAVVFLFCAWITYLSWPAVPAGGRGLRILMLILVLAVGFVHLV